MSKGAIINAKELAARLGISEQAVNQARKDGRITATGKVGREFNYDGDQAEQDYFANTRQPKSKRFERGDFDSGLGGQDTEVGGSVLDIAPRFWNIQQAQNAKAIFDAELKKLELDKEAGKYLPTTEVEKEIMRISSEFSRALVAMPSKLKQKIEKLEASDLEIIKDFCTEIVENIASKIVGGES